MDCSSVETPVFINTNLGTRIALPILPHITAKEFKRKIEKAHLSCFPEVGKIRVNGLMVKRKSCNYYLSQSMPLKYAFQGSRGAWFLQIEVHKRGNSDLKDSFECNGTKVYDHISAGDDVACSVKLNGFMCSDKNEIQCKRRKNKLGSSSPGDAFLKFHTPDNFSGSKKRAEKVKREYLSECPEQKWDLISERLAQAPTGATVSCVNEHDSSGAAEAPSVTLSESISVSGIIKKYFSNYDEVSSSGFSCTAMRIYNKNNEKARMNCNQKNVRSDLASPVTCHIPSQMPLSPWPHNTESEAFKHSCKKPKVGKRLLLASNGLGLSPSNQVPTLSLCKFSYGRSTFPKSATAIRNLAFEIPDDDDDD